MLPTGIEPASPTLKCVHLITGALKRPQLRRRGQEFSANASGEAGIGLVNYIPFAGLAEPNFDGPVI